MRFLLRTKRAHWLMIYLAIISVLACTVAQVAPVTQVVEVTEIVPVTQIAQATRIVEVPVPVVEVTRVVPVTRMVEIEVPVEVEVPVTVEVPEKAVEVTRVVVEIVEVEVPVEVTVEVPEKPSIVWVTPIVWVIVPAGETDRVTVGAGKVVELLEAETGLVFQVRVAIRYAGAIEDMCADPAKAHMSSLPTFAYVMAADRGCAEAAMLSVLHGSPTYNGQFIVRADSGITDISQLAGKTFCRPDPLSMSGWVIPSIMLKAAGVDPDTDLAEVVDAGSHDAVAAAVYDGTCDVGATDVGARTRIEKQYPDVWEQTVVIALEPDIPKDGVQFQTSVPQEIRDQIVAGLLAIASTEEGAEALDTAFQWEELMKADDSFYDVCRQVLWAAGVSAEDLVEGHY